MPALAQPQYPTCMRARCTPNRTRHGACPFLTCCASAAHIGYRHHRNPRPSATPASRSPPAAPPVNDPAETECDRSSFTQRPPSSRSSSSAICICGSAWPGARSCLAADHRLPSGASTEQFSVAVSIRENSQRARRPGPRCRARACRLRTRRASAGSLVTVLRLQGSEKHPPCRCRPIRLSSYD